MSKQIPSEMFDAYAQEKKAEAKRREEFAALFDKGAVGVKDGKLDMDHIRWFFSKLVDEFNSGVVSGYDYPMWDTIGKVLSFDMDFSYAYIDTPEDRPPTVEKDLCGMSGWLSEESAQQEMHVALKGYLVAAGALARRIGSSTYEGWRQLLVDREFCQRRGSYFFGSEQEFKAFHGKLTELTHLLWADNEIARHISTAHTAPHTTKNTPKKRGCEGGCMCVSLRVMGIIGVIIYIIMSLFLISPKTSAQTSAQLAHISAHNAQNLCLSWAEAS